MSNSRDGKKHPAVESLQAEMARIKRVVHKGFDWMHSIHDEPSTKWVISAILATAVLALVVTAWLRPSFGLVTSAVLLVLVSIYGELRLWRGSKLDYCERHQGMVLRLKHERVLDNPQSDKAFEVREHVGIILFGRPEWFSWIRLLAWAIAAAVITLFLVISPTMRITETLLVISLVITMIDRLLRWNFRRLAFDGEKLIFIPSAFSRKQWEVKPVRYGGFIELRPWYTRGLSALRILGDDVVVVTVKPIVGEIREWEILLPYEVARRMDQVQPRPRRN